MLVVAFLLVPQLVSLVAFGVDAVSGGYLSVRTALASEVLPDLGGAVIAVAAIGWLHWGRVVRLETRRARPWVMVVPLSLIVLSAAMTDYENLLEQGPALVLVLVAGTFCTGLSEELMFRGLALQAFRGVTREGWAAMWSSLLFGGLHLVNALVSGPAAIPQALFACVVGYYLYLTRRAAGGIVLPIVVHWLFDFSSFSGELGLEEPRTSDFAFYEFLLIVALGLLLVLRRRRISSAAVDVPAAESSTGVPAP
ncbi:CPBP family intramembrane glutamic endopeptidase [Cellulomonas soli]|uniref:CPBP family intramembrane glutamic endopeptidase n=1 Tax=Cellulomonas soli TaxID=931535 RepID=UPI0015C74A32|nr:CPBP family intramembrane glutamic endopeptidase [Cellulomonas soli]NYI59193.1 hypothetical protein [Cellulomonas soli]